MTGTERLYEYKISYRRSRFQEQGKKYAQCVDDNAAIDTLEFMVSRIDGGANPILIEKYCPYRQQWLFVKSYEN